MGGPAGRGSRRLSGGERLRTDREYRDLVRRGERLSTEHFTVYRDHRLATARAGGEAPRKVGVSVGRRVGGAVLRNRVKRILREFYRNHKEAFPPGSRTAIVAKKAPGTATLASVTAELLPALRRKWGVPCERKG